MRIQIKKRKEGSSKNKRRDHLKIKGGII